MQHKQHPALNPTSRLMLTCMGASQASEAVFRMAVAWWLLGATGSASLFGLVIAASNCAMTFTHAALGWLGDRYPRRVVIASAYGIDMVACCTLCFLAFTDIAPAVLVGGLLVLGTVGNTLAGPLHSTIALQGAPQEQAQEFIRERTSLTSLVMIGGPVLAGALLSVLDPKTIMLVHAIVLLAICASLWVTAARVGTQQGQAPGLDVSARGRMRLIFSGLGLLWKVTPERSLCLQAMLGNLVIYPLFAVILPVLVKEQLQMPAWALGLAGACFGVGALVSSTWIAKPVISKMGRYSAVLTARVITIVGLGFATACFALGSSPESTLWLTGALPGLVGAGIGFSVLNIAVSQARAIATPDALRNRLLTAAAAIVTLAIPLGSASAGWLLAHVAPVGVLVAVVLVLAVATLLLWADAPTRSLLETPDAQLPAAYGTYLRDEGVAVRPAAS